MKKKTIAKKKEALKIQRDCYNLDVALCTWIIPRLKHFMIYNSYPARLESIDIWRSILTQIIEGFEYYEKTRNSYDLEETRIRSKRMKESMNLLTEYMSFLWN